MYFLRIPSDCPTAASTIVNITIAKVKKRNPKTAVTSNFSILDFCLRDKVKDATFRKPKSINRPKDLVSFFYHCENLH